MLSGIPGSKEAATQLLVAASLLHQYEGITPRCFSSLFTVVSPAPTGVCTRQSCRTHLFIS
jgi:hypothetical protein